MTSRGETPAPVNGAVQDPLGHASAAPASRGERLPWTYFLIFLIGTALVVAAMWYHIDSQRQSFRASWRGQVESIANDRGRLVDNWLQSRHADAEVLAASPAVKALLSTSGRGDEALLARHLNRVAAAYGYAAS